LVGSVVDFNTNFPVIPRENWPELIKEKEAKKLRLSDIRNIADKGQPIRSYDQNGQGYCWAYSTTAAITMARAAANMPHVRLSAHSIACKIKGFRDQGGWNGESVEFAIKNGVVPESLWPAKSMARNLDNAANWEAAKAFCITEGFLDMAQPIWGKEMTFDQLASCLLLNIPCPSDFDWWGHSVLAMDLEEADDKYPLTDIRRWAIRIWNSWQDSWGANGTGVIIGKKAIPMGATAIRVAGQVS
jgi:C1A family cysteine protease